MNKPVQFSLLFLGLATMGRYDDASSSSTSAENTLAARPLVTLADLCTKAGKNDWPPFQTPKTPEQLQINLQRAASTGLMSRSCFYADEELMTLTGATSIEHLPSRGNAESSYEHILIKHRPDVTGHSNVGDFDISVDVRIGFGHRIDSAEFRMELHGRTEAPNVQSITDIWHAVSRLETSYGSDGIVDSTIFDRVSLESYELTRMFIFTNTDDHRLENMIVHMDLR